MTDYYELNCPIDPDNEEDLQYQSITKDPRRITAMTE